MNSYIDPIWVISAVYHMYVGEINMQLQDYISVTKIRGALNDNWSKTISKVNYGLLFRIGSNLPLVYPE